jgi:hypothetical protein
MLTEKKISCRILFILLSGSFICSFELSNSNECCKAASILPLGLICNFFKYSKCSCGVDKHSPLILSVEMQSPLLLLSLHVFHTYCCRKHGSANTRAAPEASVWSSPYAGASNDLNKCNNESVELFFVGVTEPPPTAVGW